MAIKNSLGHYLRVIKVDVINNTVTSELYKSKADRQTPTAFNKPFIVVDSVASVVFDQKADVKLSVRDNLKKRGYDALKTTTLDPIGIGTAKKYADWIDDI